MKITACPLCGSKNVGTGGIRDAVHPQEFMKLACRDCGWTGTPLEFDTVDAYQQFLDQHEKNEPLEDNDFFQDPAIKAPMRRFIFRIFWTEAIILFAFVVPAIVFWLVSIVGRIPPGIGAICTLASFIGYIYVVWKKELWNKIKR